MGLFGLISGVAKNLTLIEHFLGTGRLWDISNVEKSGFTHDLYYWLVKDIDMTNVVTAAEVLDCQVILKGDDPYGAVIGGELTLRTFWIPWPLQKLWLSVRTWPLPPLVNKFDRKILDQYTFEERGCEQQIICSFDELPKEKSTYYNPGFYLDVSLAHILRGVRQFALLLKPDKDEGKFVKVGVAELPCTLDDVDLEEGGWEIKEVTIV